MIQETLHGGGQDSARRAANPGGRRLHPLLAPGGLSDRDLPRRLSGLLAQIDRAIATPNPRVTAIETENALWGQVSALAHVVARLGELSRFLGLFADEADAEAKLGVRL